MSLERLGCDLTHKGNHAHGGGFRRLLESPDLLAFALPIHVFERLEADAECSAHRVSLILRASAKHGCRVDAI